MTKKDKRTRITGITLSDDLHSVSSRRVLLSHSRFRQWRVVLGGIVVILIVGCVALGLEVWKQYCEIVAGLPTVDGLRSYQPPVMSRIYAGDDRLVAELARERRIFIPYTAIPDKVKNAFLAAEDRNFWVHKGVDPFAIVRAALTDLIR
ncbi:MAG: transglycosylase domain-containing protein, partial [Acetobacter sp.]|nr:transglycosylase domain-containing protein [Acetobacter sp.]